MHACMHTCIHTYNHAHIYYFSCVQWYMCFVYFTDMRIFVPTIYVCAAPPEQSQKHAAGTFGHPSSRRCKMPPAVAVRTKHAHTHMRTHAHTHTHTRVHAHVLSHMLAYMLAPHACTTFLHAYGHIDVRYTDMRVHWQGMSENM